ncbi:nucleotide exchange factor GrpE [Candidatus Parcubacteria bacterium]|nr:nucleotide exchange factor GrpE [Candidatus Parcubacteria bacterium]
MNTDANDEIKIDLDTELDTDLDIKLEPLAHDIEPEIDHLDEDDIISEDESENPKAALKKLKDELKLAKQEKMDMLTNWQKDKAEFINARKRDEEAKQEIIKYSNQMLIGDLLPIIDGYEQAKAQPTWTAVDEAWRKGIEAIIEKVYGALKKVGVESYGTVGDQFDPNIYEALGQDVTTEKEKDHTVSMVMQKGYKLHDKVIRVALVKVYQV